MEITRRNLLGASAAVGAGLLLPLQLKTAANAVVPAGVTPFTEQLPTLAELGTIDATVPDPATKRASAAITMVNASHKFHTALGATPTFTYRTTNVNGTPVIGTQSYLGPVIVAMQNVPLDLTVTNNLGTHPLASSIDTALGGALAADGAAPRAAVHLHGGNTDPGNDGDPTDTFLPGSARTYHYENTQEAAGLWYHDHALGITRLNVFAGLAGGYLIRNADDLGDGSRLPAYLPGLPGQPGQNYEVPLVIQDRMFLNTNGFFNYPANVNPGTAGQPWAPEFFGDVATVNGKAWPNLNVDRGKYRFRVYNGSNARFYNLQLTSGKNTLPFFQIGSDGGLLNAPVPLSQLLLGPGERADLVVDFALLPAGTLVVLTNNAPVPFPGGPRKARKGGMPLPQIMQFRVTSNIGWTTPLPTTLRTTPITRYAATQATGNGGIPRRVTLVENLNALGSPLMALLNNRSFDENAANVDNAHVRTNTLEQWDIINTTVDAHPIHLHFTQFQILNRQKFNSAGYFLAAYGAQPLPVGAGTVPPPPVTGFLKGTPVAPAANELGWKDTVVAMPGEVTRILVPFGANAGGQTAFTASHTGSYVWHCHILEHEDNDMMQRFVIE